MADLERTSSFLPTIKCSMCAADIEISHMGDHICAGGEPTPPPESYGNFEEVPFEKESPKVSEFLRPGRTIPPRVDTSIANRPFFPPPEQSTLNSSLRSNSPFTPNDGSRSPRPGRPLRSATLPIPRAPPSPELLSSNLDCAFPPFPMSKPVKAKPQLTVAYGGDHMYAPVSPRTATSGGLLQRMNTIAPGPFDIDGQKKLASPVEERGHQRQKTLGSSKDMIIGNAEIGASIQRPATAGAGYSRSSTRSSHSSNDSRSDFGLPKQPRKNGYGGFGKPSTHEENEQMSLTRSETAPLPSLAPNETPRRSPDTDGSMRRPSIQVGQPKGSERSISRSPPRQRKQSISGPDRTRPLPPRGASLIRPGPRVDIRAGDAPPVPININLAAEFGIGNPYHTPSESQSSSASGYSQRSTASTHSSPPSATVDRQKLQADINNPNGLLSGVQSSMMDLQPKELYSALPPLKNEQFATGLLPPRSLDPSLVAPESPMDPAIQDGKLSPIMERNAFKTVAAVSPPILDPVRRPTTSKGNCKGCGEVIKGKSVSSADGRLTGRYHKQCFVCQTCREPFQTATFYVHNDRPYCERHYHKLNGSVCTGCDKGIEGQYLESERKQKFHPTCLTCSDCKRTLRNGYFEMNGAVFCERDAFKRAQSQKRFLGPGSGGSNRMERRTTRLMMM